MLSKKVKAEDILSAIRGPQGRAGYDGCDGLDGSDGKEGGQGKAGMHGDPGARGPVGPQGVKGDKGDQGRTGQAGEGKDGISVIGSTINNRGDLIIKLSNGDLINAGRAKGQPGPPGQPGRNGGIITTGSGGGGVESKFLWGLYATNALTNGNNTTIAAGEVLEYVLDAVVIYRFFTTAVDSQGYPNEDSFYSAFDGVNLTGLIATRGTS